MTARLASIAGAACGLAVLAVAGVTIGGGWWLVAVVGAAGALSGRPGSLVHAVSTLALAGAAATADQMWLIPLLVLGIVVTVETAALPASTNRIRTSVPVGRAVAAPILAAASAAGVLALAGLAPDFAVPVAFAGVLAAVALVTALRA